MKVIICEVIFKPIEVDLFPAMVLKIIITM